MVILKGIPIEYTSDFITSSIIEQNTDIQESINEKTEITPLFKCGPKGRDTVNWVLEVTPEIYRKMVKTRLYVGYLSTKPTPYQSAFHCRRCLSLKHKTTDCKSEITCWHCGEAGHTKQTCTARLEGQKPKCNHCEKGHATMSQSCNTWRHNVIKNMENTNYGQEKPPSLCREDPPGT